MYNAESKYAQIQEKSRQQHDNARDFDSRLLQWVDQMGHRHRNGALEPRVRLDGPNRHTEESVQQRGHTFSSSAWGQAPGQTTPQDRRQTKSSMCPNHDGTRSH